MMPSPSRSTSVWGEPCRTSEGTFAAGSALAFAFALGAGTLALAFAFAFPSTGDVEPVATRLAAGVEGSVEDAPPPPPLPAGAAEPLLPPPAEVEEEFGLALSS